MQTLRVVKTIRWVEEIIPKEVKEALFRFTPGRPDCSSEQTLSMYMNAAHLFGAASAQISENEEAVAVLKAFGLGTLLDPQVMIQKFVTDIASGDDSSLHQLYRKLTVPYENMV